jgi:hypothetical protein
VKHAETIRARDLEGEYAPGVLQPAQFTRRPAHLHALLDIKLVETFFDRMSEEWRRAQDECLRLIERLNSADQSYLEDGIRILELAQSARRLFERQERREKRRLLDFVLSNSTWKSGQLHATLQETAAAAELARAAGLGDAVKSEIWLGD